MSASAMLPGAYAEDLPPDMAAETSEEARAKIIAGHAAFNAKTLRVDLFAVRDGGAVDGALRVIGADLPVLEAGKTYLIEAVVRTLNIGHEFTQGTADSNEAWLWARAALAGREVGTTGGIDTASGALDPCSTTTRFRRARAMSRISRSMCPRTQARRSTSRSRCATASSTRPTSAMCTAPSA